MNNPLVTVVIPVYNAAPYIARCLTSCIEQDFDSFEIVCVDDGSKDESAKIIENFSRRNPRVRLISQPNGGVVRARSAGVRNAKSDWILFVDADDWLDRGAIKALFSGASDDIDIVSADHFLDKDGTCIVRQVEYTCDYMDGRNYVNQCMRLHHGYIWGKLYRRTMLLGLEIDPSYKLNEDYLINVSCGLQSRHVVHIHKPVYHYFWDSTIDRIKCLPIESEMSVLKVHKDVLRILSCDERSRYVLKDGYLRYLMHNCINCCCSGMYISDYVFYKKQLRKALISTNCIRCLGFIAKERRGAISIACLLFSVKLARFVHRVINKV